MICVVRDEMTHLPHFLQHYRAAGVKRFAFVDNGSVDDTVSYLAAQDDCAVYQHTGDYLDASAGTVWRNLLLRASPAARWHLLVDADEHAVYDGWPDLGLDAFAAAMSGAGQSAVTAVMIDMYGPGPVLQTRVGPGASLLDACPLFDGDDLHHRNADELADERLPRLNIRGGQGDARHTSPARRSAGSRKRPWYLSQNILLRNPHTVDPAGLNFAPPRMALLHFRFFDYINRRLEQVGAGKPGDAGCGVGLRGGRSPASR